MCKNNSTTGAKQAQENYTPFFIPVYPVFPHTAWSGASLPTVSLPSFHQDFSAKASSTITDNAANEPLVPSFYPVLSLNCNPQYLPTAGLNCKPAQVFPNAYILFLILVLILLGVNKDPLPVITRATP